MQDNNEDNMTVFNDLYASSYDALYSDKDYSAECELITRLIEASGNEVKSVLDIGCGTGGHLIPLAHMGYNLTGVDPSRSMLEIAKRKLARNNISGIVNFINQTAAGFSSDTKYDFAIMMFAVIGYHSKNDEVISCLTNVRKHLSAGANLVFDFWYGPAVLHDEPSDRVKTLDFEAEKIIRITKPHLDSFAHTTDVIFETIKISGKVVTSHNIENHKMRYFFPQEIDMFLQTSGFRLCSLTAFPSLDAELNKETWNALCVAEAI